MAASMIHDARNLDKTIHFLVHRKDLITQTMKALDDVGIDYSVIASGYIFNPFARVQICSIDTLKNRLDKIPKADLVFVDECHLGGSAGWSTVINHYKKMGSWLIGLSATPERTDGKGLGMHFQTMVSGPSMSWLIENKFLSDYLLYAPSSPDLSGLRGKADYTNAQLEQAMNHNVLVGDAIKHYKKLAYRKRAICYCISRERSKETAQKFIDAGISAAHIDGETPMDERRRIIWAFATGTIDILCNVDLITTGFDLAAQVDMDVTVECIILLRPTKSLTLYLQMVGRGLRPKNHPCVIIDHAGLSKEWPEGHGLPDDQHDWTLDDKERRGGNGEKTIPTRQCTECFFVHRPSPKCPACGFSYPIQYREIEEIEGDLVAVDRDSLRKSRRTEQGMAKNMDELTTQFIAQGMTPWKAATRAAHIITAREAKARKKNV